MASLMENFFCVFPIYLDNVVLTFYKHEIGICLGINTPQEKEITVQEKQVLLLQLNNGICH